MALFEYRARCRRVVDGDTYDLELDLGFHLTRAVRVRLAGIDTHEISGQPRESLEFRRGTAERLFVEEWFAAAAAAHDGDWPVVVTTSKDRTGKFGRYVADVRRRSDGTDLATSLVASFGDVRYG
jgi:micrococcal nuclease